MSPLPLPQNGFDQLLDEVLSMAPRVRREAGVDSPGQPQRPAAAMTDDPDLDPVVSPPDPHAARLWQAARHATENGPGARRAP